MHCYIIAEVNFSLKDKPPGHADDRSPRHAISKNSFAMAVRMRKVLARPRVGVRVCHLLLLFFFAKIASHADPHVAHRAVFLWDVPERYRATHSR